MREIARSPKYAICIYFCTAKQDEIMYGHITKEWEKNVYFLNFYFYALLSGYSHQRSFKRA